MSPTTRSRTWVNRWVFASARRRRSVWERISPPQLLLGSFLLLILLGTLGLKLLPTRWLYTGNGLSWLDALFTATSAVCVTGLIVVDTATYFTTVGQAFLLLLIQLGGLGIITFTTLVMAALGRRLSLRHESLSASAVEVTPHLDLPTADPRRRTLHPRPGDGRGGLAVRAVAAPGLALGASGRRSSIRSARSATRGSRRSTDSMMDFQDVATDPGGHLALDRPRRHRVPDPGGDVPVAPAQGRQRRYRLSLHSRIVLIVTALLLLVGWALAAVMEWNVTLRRCRSSTKLINALFMSVTPRTAGFNNIDYVQATDGTNFLTILLMFIGGSPGSTAGGLKTTTVALPALLAWSRLPGPSRSPASGAGRSRRKRSSGPSACASSASPWSPPASSCSAMTETGGVVAPSGPGRLPRSTCSKSPAPSTPWACRWA